MFKRLSQELQNCVLSSENCGVTIPLEGHITKKYVQMATYEGFSVTSISFSPSRQRPRSVKPLPSLVQFGTSCSRTRTRSVYSRHVLGGIAPPPKKKKFPIAPPPNKRKYLWQLRWKIIQIICFHSTFKQLFSFRDKPRTPLNNTMMPSYSYYELLSDPSPISHYKLTVLKAVLRYYSIITVSGYGLDLMFFNFSIIIT